MAKWFGCDRRKSSQHKATVLIIFFFTAWLLTTAYAETAKHTVGLEEHAQSIMGIESYMIVILFGALTSLAAWIFVYLLNDIKKTMRDNHAALTKAIKSKVSIQVHNAICDHRIDVEETGE